VLPSSKTSVNLLFALLAACGGGGGGGSADGPDLIPQGEISIAGSVSVAPATAVDKDTNDPNSPPASGPDNDYPYDPPNYTTNNDYDGQLLPNPGTVGGFVGFPEFAGSGSAADQFDFDDFYRVSLLAGQTVSLLISDHRENEPLKNDLDLILLDIDLNLVDYAAGFGAQESLVVREDGEYFVWVSVCAYPLIDIFICGDGASNYILSVGQGDATPAAAGLRLSSDFVPGEALVRYRDSQLANADSDNVLQATASSVQENMSRVGDVGLVKFPERPLIASAASSQLDGAKRAAGEPWIKLSAEQRAKLDTIANIKQLAAQTDIDVVEPNYIRQPLFVPDDPGYEFQWHYPLINLPAAWDLGYFGDFVSVAVLDTGILPFHPDIEGQLDLTTGGYDFISSADNARDGNGVDDDPTDPGDSGFIGFSSSFHGTHVAGTIAAATNNGGGVAGIAPNARILPVRVLGQFGGSSFDIRRGLCFAAGLSTGANCEGVPENPSPAAVINLSLGGPDFSSLEQSLIDEIRAANNTIIVAAAGNSGTSQPFYPAAYSGVVAVSAVGIDRSLAPYSTFGSFVDVAAPGGDYSTDINGDGYVDGVLSTGGNDSQGPVEYNYTFLQGTSMAAPHVAGVLALMRSANSAMTPDVIDAMLAAGELTVPVGSAGNGSRDDFFGYGLIDAQKAVSAALASDGNPPEPQPRLGVLPGGLNFGATLEALPLTVRNNSGGELDVISIESSEPWLLAPAVNGLTEYSVRVNRDALAEGNYSATLTITSNVNTVIVPVIMQKSNAILTGDAGHLYVRLIDPETGAIREVQSDAVDGEYTWRIGNLPPGRYQLIAYTNADNDNRLCDAGEACGSYITADQPIFIELQTDLSGLDFPVSFGAALSDPDDSDKPL
jgi:serine protease